jgi:hypothetical protein
MSGETNKGIIIHGGTMNSRNTAVGDHAAATSNDIHQAPPQLDLPQLAAELQQLRNALRQRAKEREHDAAVVAVGDAEQAAGDGDGQTALEYLKKGGKWALDVAKEIGVSVASEALKTALKV